VKPHRLIDPALTFWRHLAPRDPAASGVLLISAGGLGDTVLFSLVLPRFMKLARPGEAVTVLLRSDGAKMSFLFPKGVQVLAVDFGKLRQIAYRRRILEQLYAAHYRLVVSTDFLRHPDLDEALAMAADAPESAAMVHRPWPKHESRLRANARDWGRLVDTGPIKIDKVVRWATFCDALLGEVEAPPVVTLRPDQLPDLTPTDKPLVVIQPFSAVKAKQSPPDLYARIIGALPAGLDIRIAGHPSDLDKNPDYKPLLDLPGVRFEPAPFAQLAGLLRGAKLVLSVDTACMHLACALGAPTLCLASAAYVGEIVPYAPQVTPPSVRFLYQPMECQGCLGDCRLPLVGTMYPCVAALDGTTAVETAKAMVEEGL
jgi:ADP-heptose:LPS heptosyltransferase